MRIAFMPSCGIGYEVLPDGTWMVRQNNLNTADTKIRCDEGAKYFKAGGVDIIFCTGGIFLPPYLQTEPASKLMKDYLVSCHNIPSEKVWIEEESLDSWQNVEKMKETLLGKGINLDEVEIDIFSHWTHTLRLKRLLRYHGFQKVFRFNLRYRIGWKMYVYEIVSNFLVIIDPAGKSFFVKKERGKRRQ